MSGLLFHCVSDSQQCLAEEQSEKIVELSSSFKTVAEENGNIDRNNKLSRSSVGRQARPPVAYASVAPFPFLPVPSYSAPCVD